SETTLRVQTHPLKIIENACISDWTTYEGRRRAVIQHMNFYQKVPIPTSIQHRQIFFPTHSPKHIDNSWIAAHHIMQIKKYANKATIQFSNGYHLTLNISYHILRKQTIRAHACLEKITMQQLTRHDSIDRKT